MSRGIKGGLAAGIVAAVLIPAGSASASYGPNNTGDGCFVASQGGSCVWTADVAGEYAVLGQSYTVEQQVTDPVTHATSWQVVSSGPGGNGAAPGALVAGNTYRLTVVNGAGAMGSLSGTGGA